MHVAALTVELRIPGCTSLKQKRSRLKPLLARLQKEFNVSVAEIDLNDHHQLAVIACVVVSNASGHAQRMLAGIPKWIETHRPDLQIIDDHITLL
jgi:uncharacterized protein YlxP (DUF503 family)